MLQVSDVGSPQRPHEVLAMARIADIGEFGLIRRIAAVLGPAGEGVFVGIGDDAAVLATDGRRSLLASSDMLIEGVHFDLAYFSPEDLGRRLVAVNLSDIAAMGGIPRWALVSLGLRPEMEADFVERMYTGMDEVAREFGLTIVGGDTCRSPRALVIDMCILGESGERITLRSGARPGDLVLVTGQLGASAAGLGWLRNLKDGEDPAILPRTAVQEAERAHLAPRPRVREGQVLASDPRVTAVDDVSDGLAAEVGEICTASGVGARIELGRLPVSAAAAQIGPLLREDPTDLALYGGEDYELLFTFRGSEEEAAALAEKVLQDTGTAVTTIGWIVPASKGIKAVFLDGREVSLARRGYDHFAPAEEKRRAEPATDSLGR